MRAFIAIDLTESIHAALAREQTAFREACRAAPHHLEDIRWTRPEGIHLTLKFLGEISEEKVRQVTDVLSPLGTFEKFPVEVKGFGFFPNARHPRVFWAGVEAPSSLQTLAARVDEAMEKVGFAREQRAFTPHLTLARFKSPRAQPALEVLLKQKGEISLGRFEASEFFLFESKLGPQGAKYVKVAKFPDAKPDNKIEG